MSPKVGDRKLHAFALCRVIPGTDEYANIQVVEAFFAPSDTPDSDAPAAGQGMITVRSPYVYPGDRYPRQALRRGWTRVSKDTK